MRHVLLAFLLIPAATAAAAGDDRVFPADAVVDVTKAPYLAKPDDNHDDTAAIQRAITDNVETGRYVYFPAGVYDIRDTLVARNAKGLWRARLVLQGQSEKRTILRLADAAPGFGDPTRPKAVLMTGSHWQKGDAEDGGGNKAFGNSLFDLIIEVGKNNPGAIGVEYAVSNFGAIKRVTLKSADGNGVAGIALHRRIPGPGLIKSIHVDGFDVGIDVGDIQYGVTIEDVTLVGQRVASIRTTENPLHIRKLTSITNGPAIQVTKPNGMLTLIDSRLEGNDARQPGIDCAGSALIRNVNNNRFGKSPVRLGGKTVEGEFFREVVHPVADALADRPSSALLEIEPTPEYLNANLADWAPVGQRLSGESDDTAAIQRAIDSGKSTIYFPNNRTYFLSDTLVVRGKVRQILGLGSELSLGAAEKPFSDPANPRPLFRIDPVDAETLFIEGVFFNAQYPGELLFENNSPKTLVIQHCAGWVGAKGHRRSYRNTPSATGKLFIEDVFLPGWEFTKQSVWARQFNPENPDGDGTTPQVANRGGKLWILGFKTEGPAPFIATTDNGVTELLGAYNYISATHAPRVPRDAVPYIVKDARANLTFVADNFRDNDYAAYIRTTQSGQTRDTAPAGLIPRNGHRGDRSLVAPLIKIAPPATSP